MSRPLSSDFLNLLSNNVQNIAILMEFFFDSGTLRLWDGYTPVTFDGNTYTGGGQLLSLSAINDTNQVRADNITIGLEGVSTDILSYALNENYQGRRFNLHVGLRSNNNPPALVDAATVFSGIMDVMTSEDNGKSATISLTVESGYNRLLNPRTWRYTHEDQQTLFPGDNAFKYVVSIQGKSLGEWGKAS